MKRKITKSQGINRILYIWQVKKIINKYGLPSIKEKFSQGSYFKGIKWLWEIK